MSCEGIDLHQISETSLGIYYQVHRGLKVETRLARMGGGRTLSFSFPGPESLKRAEEILAVLTAAYGRRTAQALVIRVGSDIGIVLTEG